MDFDQLTNYVIQLNKSISKFDKSQQGRIVTENIKKQKKLKSQEPMKIQRTCFKYQ